MNRYKYLQRRPIQFNNLRFDGVATNFSGGATKQSLNFLTSNKSERVVCNTKFELEDIRFTAKIKIPECLSIENTTVFVNWVNTELAKEGPLYAIDVNGDIIKTEAVLTNFAPVNKPYNAKLEMKFELEFSSTSNRWERLDYNSTFFYEGDPNSFWSDALDNTLYQCSRCSNLHPAFTEEDSGCDDCTNFKLFCDVEEDRDLWDTCTNEYTVIENCKVAYENSGNIGIYGKMVRIDNAGKGTFAYFGGTNSEDGIVRVSFKFADSPSININSRTISSTKYYANGVFLIDTASSVIKYDKLDGSKPENVIADFTINTTPFFTILPINNSLNIKGFKYPVVNLRFREYVL